MPNAKPDLVKPAERERLREDETREKNWKRWGPYLSERQWGTVREDYSVDGSCWTYFPHEQARSRAYRWGEDGLLGWCDRECRLCFSVALWNGRDAILKERLFGLTNPQGNHGEDVKESYHYLEALPTHAWNRASYHYPTGAFPYQDLIDENARRTRNDDEYELADNGALGSYFDVQADYAKASPDDTLIRITITNRSAARQALHVLPQWCFRNTWAWGPLLEDITEKPNLWAENDHRVTAEHQTLGRFVIEADADAEWLFTDNDTNGPALFNTPHTAGLFYKDAFHRRIVHGDEAAVNPQRQGTKCGAWMTRRALDPGETFAVRLRLRREEETSEAFSAEFDEVMTTRRAEYEAFVDNAFAPRGGNGKPKSGAKAMAGFEAGDPRQLVARQAGAGLLWSKQFYHYVITEWLAGDPFNPPPPERDDHARNKEWKHLFNRDVISMPDKWEYPWYAAWDLAFHMIPMARLDPAFAKDQLLLLLREWYMHPSGQLPAYEFNFSDVNPPVHAWACWRVYKMTAPHGKRDRAFLARAFQKLMLNFTWWVNRKDASGKNLFGGGFLGLDNIGAFDRNTVLPDGARLEQADGTAWMAFFCGTMLSMALELASEDPVYEDVASKFFEHYVAIIDAINSLGGRGLWDEQDGFYYDQIFAEGKTTPLRIRSIVGLIPLFAVEVLDDDMMRKLPGFSKRMKWFLDHKPGLRKYVPCANQEPNAKPARHLLALPTRDRLQRVLKYLFDEDEFLSPYGVRSLSKVHEAKPFEYAINGTVSRVVYEPGESRSDTFGGNSNWRGPVWFPINFLLLESLEKFHYFYGDTLTIDCPATASRINLGQVAALLRKRLIALFLPDSDGKRPCHGDDANYRTGGPWAELLLFYEFFHGDTGRGLGASHQTGWTAVVAELIRGDGSSSRSPGVN